MENLCWKWNGTWAAGVQPAVSWNIFAWSAAQWAAGVHWQWDYCLVSKSSASHSCSKVSTSRAINYLHLVAFLWEKLLCNMMPLCRTYELRAPLFKFVIHRRSNSRGYTISAFVTYIYSTHCFPTFAQWSLVWHIFWYFFFNFAVVQKK